MKKAFIAMTFVFTAAFVFSQSDSITENQFELKGKIINGISLPPPHCGIVAWATVVEFEIIEFSDPNYKLDSIGVVFTCPEFYSSGFFEVGRTYNLTLSDENEVNFDWSIPNEHLLSKYQTDQKLWVLKAKKKRLR